MDPNEELARAASEADRVLVMRAFGQRYVPTEHRPEDAMAVAEGGVAVARALDVLRVRAAPGAVLRAPEVKVVLLAHQAPLVSVGVLVPLARSTVWDSPYRLDDPAALVCWFRSIGVPDPWGLPNPPSSRSRQQWSRGELDDQYWLWRSLIEAVAPDLDPRDIDRLCLLDPSNLLTRLSEPIPALGHVTLNDAARDGRDAMVQSVLGRWEEAFGTAR